TARLPTLAPPTARAAPPLAAFATSGTFAAFTALAAFPRLPLRLLFDEPAHGAIEFLPVGRFDPEHDEPAVGRERRAARSATASPARLALLVVAADRVVRADRDAPGRRPVRAAHDELA